MLLSLLLVSIIKRSSYLLAALQASVAGLTTAGNRGGHMSAASSVTGMSRARLVGAPGDCWLGLIVQVC
jgi:hypothetical protein